ncbi:hypothetical protein Val02_40230 [Virgisporangium aliadipatigenens]|uniref:Uncharacterized protein n=1 Tax=Virgisporangium aliadipatigenens TaxID=741659 RepID=A0A8J3YMS4_9ACTN|nr:hypothetical protein Val02_40230 [Virgisporangium aliadipatigenens]
MWRRPVSGRSRALPSRGRVGAVLVAVRPAAREFVRRRAPIGVGAGRGASLRFVGALADSSGMYSSRDRCSRGEKVVRALMRVSGERFEGSERLCSSEALS